jgi:hypothetical protein
MHQYKVTVLVKVIRAAGGSGDDEWYDSSNVLCF